MDFDINILDRNERTGYSLCSLYKSRGYSQYRMSKFEEYDLYVRNKEFLISDNIITFTDTNGKLMALKPDVTLSIIKSSRNLTDAIAKLFYKENVYRIDKASGSYKEIMQVGLECLGEVGSSEIGEVLWLAAESLKQISDGYVLVLSNLDILMTLADRVSDKEEIRKKLMNCAGDKNIHGIDDVCRNAGIDPEKAAPLKKLLGLYGAPGTVMDEITVLCEAEGLTEACEELRAAVQAAEADPHGGRVQIDFSLVSDIRYYNGIVFKGFINGIPDSILSGGQYDRLMERMDHRKKAIGYALYMDRLDFLNESQEDSCPEAESGKPAGEGNGAAQQMIRIALPKGRLGDRVYGILEKAGYKCSSARDGGRRLIFDSDDGRICFFWAKPSDVAVYVERGAADIGVAGKDILEEYKPNVYELADLKTGVCRMCVAGPADFTDSGKRPLRVATKFAHIAGKYYGDLGRDIDIIPLNGSIEIAPLLGLSDVIVDIVETGSTLKENDLTVLNEIMPISARLIANKASMSFKGAAIGELTDSIKKLIDAEDKR